MKGYQHIVPVEGKWGVKGEGNGRFTGVFDTQAEAIQIGREIAINQGGELFIHDRHGRIRERDSYGPDPFPPKG